MAAAGRPPRSRLSCVGSHLCIKAISPSEGWTTGAHRDHHRRQLLRRGSKLCSTMLVWSEVSLARSGPLPTVALSMDHLTLGRRRHPPSDPLKADGAPKVGFLLLGGCRTLPPAPSPGVSNLLSEVPSALNN